MSAQKQDNDLTANVQERFAGYGTFLEQVKQRIRSAQMQASLAVNRELLELYWNLGKEIVAHQAAQGWGDGVLPQLAKDLQAAFPGVSGFSRTNLYRIRAFYLAYRTHSEIVPPLVGQLKDMLSQTAEQTGEAMPQAVAQIPWAHNVSLLEKVKDAATREWYAQAAFEHGWSRNILEMQIESRLHERQGKAINNFARTLPPPQSDLAQALLKDPYNFEFLTLGDDAHEREIERGLLEHIRLFLLEFEQGSPLSAASTR